MDNPISLQDVHTLYTGIKQELSKVIQGQSEVIDHVLTSLFAGGHILIEGAPGLGKTLLANALSRILGGDFKRIQFTPDLMPSDIIGTTVFNPGNNTFSVKKGPVFCNLLLADEINRSPAKTQSALLQAMQEKEVSLDGTNYPLDDFFICLATQNPIEMEGTYPLPEAQVDRFLMKVLIDYPEKHHEKAILASYRDGFSAEKPETAELTQLMEKATVPKIKEVLASVRVDDKILDYITDIVGATRNYPGIAVGASPRGSVSLFQASRVIAVAEERDFVIPDDVKTVALPILRHRVILEAEAEIEGFSPDDYLKKIIDEVEVPR